VNRALITVLMLCVLAAGSDAGAAEAPRVDLKAALDALGGDFVIPPEWAGIWDIETVTETCAGAPISTETEADTLCSGANVTPDDPEEIVLDCTGTVTSTSVDIVCTGSMEIVTDCSVNYTFTIDGTRTGGSYTLVTVVEIDYEGTAIECSFIPDSCTRATTTGTKTAPEPENCAVPVEPVSWSLIKAQYRD